MFVLQGKKTEAGIREQSEIDSIVECLEEKGYVPVLRSMLRAACDSVHLSSNTLQVDSLVSVPRFRHRASPESSPMGDVLCHDDNLFLVHSQKRGFAVWEVRNHKKRSELETIVSHVESAMKSRLDGRRVRGMAFDWRDTDPLRRRRHFRTGQFQEEKLETKAPEFSDEQVEQAKVLVSKEHRELLLRLAQIGKARRVDTAAIPDNEIAQPLLDRGLIQKEYLVICREDSRTLCTVPEKRSLDDSAGSQLRCATCRRKYKDELIEEIYSLTEEAKGLIGGSHWMTIWVTSLLRAAGTPMERIKWNAAAGNDELDIIAEVQGMNVFFELKDREFGLGDAYPFSSRIERYGGNVGVILTMDKVATEAENFIREQAEKGIARMKYLEGKDPIDEGVPELVEEVSRTSVEMFFSEFTEELGIGVLPVLRSWLRK